MSGQSHGTGLYISPVEKCRCSEPEAVQDAEGFGASQMAGDVYVWLTKSSTKVWETFKIEDKSWKCKLIFYVIVNKRNAHNISWYSFSNNGSREEEKWFANYPVRFTKAL